jgi:hypothetical protein
MLTGFLEIAFTQTGPYKDFPQHGTARAARHGENPDWNLGASFAFRPRILMQPAKIH